MGDFGVYFLHSEKIVLKWSLGMVDRFSMQVPARMRGRRNISREGLIGYRSPVKGRWSDPRGFLADYKETMLDCFGSQLA